MKIKRERRTPIQYWNRLATLNFEAYTRNPEQVNLYYAFIRCIKYRARAMNEAGRFDEEGAE